MSDKQPIPVHPVQKPLRPGRGLCPQVVTMAAYEVYCAVHAPQQSLVTGNCRGGFGISELIAFLYARSFPRAEWERRVQEALAGMENL